MDWITTSTILRELRCSPDGDAWAQLVRRFRPPIVRFARSLGHTPDDAEDVAQETLAAFAKAYCAGQYDPEKGRLNQWLFGIAFRQSRRARRLNPQTVPLDDDDEVPEPESAAASAVWDREWEQTILAECFRRVRQEVEPQTFRIFELVVLESKPAAEVGQLLGLPATVIYNSKHRVITRLRRHRAMLESIQARGDREIELNPAIPSRTR